MIKTASHSLVVNSIHLPFAAVLAQVDHSNPNRATTTYRRTSLYSAASLLETLNEQRFVMVLPFNSNGDLSKDPQIIPTDSITSASIETMVVEFDDA